MNFEYALYLAFCFAGAMLLALVFDVWARLSIRRMLRAILPAALAFIAWDIVAVMRGHWSFDPAFNLGFFIANQPLEEIAFFVVIPFFYLVVWEIFKQRAEESSWNTRS